MEILVREVVGLFVWLVANAVYLDALRRGRPGFKRFLGFWMGFPGTFFTKLLVAEGSQPTVEPPPDDDASLLADVRRDRALRPGGGTDRDPGDDENDKEEGT